MQILQVLCSFSLAFSDSRSSFGELGAEPGGEVELAFLLLLEAASSLNSAEMEASSCSCWLLLVLNEVVEELLGAEPPGAEPPGAAGVDDEEVVVEVAGDLGVRLTVLLISSSTSILISSPKRFASSTLSLLLLPSPSPRLVSVAPEGFRFSNLDLRSCSL